MGAGNKQPEKKRRIWRLLRSVLVLSSTPLALAWLIGQWVYVFDLIAVYQLQIGILLGLTSLSFLIFRCWYSGVILLAYTLMSMFVVMQGRPFSVPHVDFNNRQHDTIRVISFNVNPKSEQWEADLQALLGLDADIVLLLEVPPQLNRAIRRYGLLDQTPYQHWLHRPWVDEETSPCFILSKKPLDPISITEDPSAEQHVLMAVAEIEAGSFAVGLAHPLSPRTRQRWLRGNEVIGIQGEHAEQLVQQTGLAVLMGADLNSGPAQQRARILRKHKLVQSKPIMSAAGSFPQQSNTPGVLQIQLDDIWHTAGATCVAWSQLETLGSDHKAIVADFRLRKPGVRP